MDAGPALVSILRQGTCLVVSIHTALDDAQMARLRNHLSLQIGHRRSRAVLIDLAALAVVDSFATMTLRNISEQARLRGATTIIVGIQPDVAFAMVTLGLAAADMQTALDLEEGLQCLVRDAKGTTA